MSLLKFTRKKRIDPISATTDIVVVDRNGYIGEKRPNGNTVYFGYLDTFADYSQAGLGQVTIIPNVVIGNVTIGGREYKTTKIGNQEWLAENLDYKFDVNGSQIPIGVSETPTTPAAWYYNNDEASYGIDGTYKCGLLYNWYATKYLEDNKSTLLPEGWHVPSNSEWVSLINLIGSQNAGTMVKASDNSIASGFPSNWKGIDIFQFSGIPSGNRWRGSFYSINLYADFWTSDEESSTKGHTKLLSNKSTIDDETTYNEKSSGYSLRLVKSLT